MMQKFNIFIAVLFGLLLISCSDHKMDSNLISNGSTMSNEAKEVEKNLDRASYADVADVFLNTNEIDFNKDVLLVFGKNNCQYCDLLKDMIKKDNHLKQLIKNNFNPYYINTSYTKTHIINFGNKQSNVDTHSLASLFSVDFTPSIAFLNKSGDVKYLLPGFSPKFKDLVLEVIKKDGAMGEYRDLNNRIHNL